MMFQRISRNIALQFTGLVFILLLINGLLFLAADVANARRMAHTRLLRTAEVVAEQANIALRGGKAALPLALRESIRIVDANRNPFHVGEVFQEVPFHNQEGFSSLFFDGNFYNVVTVGLRTNAGLIGYVQLAEVERIGTADLPLRASLYLAVSVAISALIFGVGRYFAGRSLRPAEQAMQQLEQFTQDASHELRTPLTALSSSLDLALKTEKYREGIQSAKEDLHQASGLLERLLEIARLGPAGIDRTKVNLSAIVEQVVEKFRPLAKENDLTIELSAASNVTQPGDEALLRQVLGNLLANAVKFKKPEGGVIRVKLTKDQLAISDQGIGIPKEALPHIFDRFFQADPSRSKEGHGLGLALVRRIIQLHGWSIAASSKLGEGTTFTIRFTSQQ